MRIRSLQLRKLGDNVKDHFREMTKMVFLLVDLGVVPVRDVLQFAVVAPFADDSVH